MASGAWASEADREGRQDESDGEVGGVSNPAAANDASTLDSSMASTPFENVSIDFSGL